MKDFDYFILGLKVLNSTGKCFWWEMVVDFAIALFNDFCTNELFRKFILEIINSTHFSWLIYVGSMDVLRNDEKIRIII